MSADRILHFLLFTLGILAGMIAGFVAEQIDTYLGMKRLNAHFSTTKNEEAK